MATEPAPETATTTATATKLKLDPPEALEALPATEAAGLVPLKSEETTELDSRVAKFVDELAALDANSPEFGKKVDQLTAMGRKEIAEAAGASNRFLDRPVKAIDKDTGIGADLIRSEAAGLVPLKSEETTELDSRVAKFVDELAALDANSPEFGKKVDQLTAMGRKEIAEAAGASNRFLDRPVKAIDKDTGIGADLI